jgi:methionyl-tRNA synthetase
MITIDDFAKVQLKVGTIISAEELEGSEKLLKLQVDFGAVIPAGETVPTVIPAEAGIQLSAEDSEDEKPENDIRQVLSGIKQWYKPEDLIGKQFVFVTNLAPRKMMGLESQAMIMAAEGTDKPIPLTVSETVPNGAGIR